MSTLATLPSIDQEASAFETPNLAPFDDPSAVGSPTNYDSILDDAYSNPIPTTTSTVDDLIPSIPSTNSGTALSDNAASTNTAASNVASTATGVLTSIWNIVTGNIENGIFVVLGLLLIAAGIFAFKPTQTLAVNAGKLGAKAAEVAAA